jgi:hypothetical protein
MFCFIHQILHTKPQYKHTYVIQYEEHKYENTMLHQILKLLFYVRIFFFLCVFVCYFVTYTNNNKKYNSVLISLQIQLNHIYKTYISYVFCTIYVCVLM